MKFVFTTALVFAVLVSKAQSVVFDRDHFNMVNQNGVMRLTSELGMQSYITQIDNRLADIKINIGAMILTQHMILSSLTQVDQGLKSALAVKEISSLIEEIFYETDQMISFASRHPHLLIFSEQISSQLRSRGLALASELSSVVLAEKADLLLNFEKRDALLKKIALELRVIRALVFSMRKSMFWAGQRSLLSQLNPYQGFINIDKRIVSSIINRYQTLIK